MFRWFILANEQPQTSMNPDFSIFRRFATLDEARQLGEFLKANDIEVEIGDNVPPIDPAFSGSTVMEEAELRIRKEDFARATKLLEKNILGTIVPHLQTLFPLSVVIAGIFYCVQLSLFLLFICSILAILNNVNMDKLYMLYIYFFSEFQKDALFDEVPGREHPSFPRFEHAIVIKNPAKLAQRVQKYSQNLDAEALLMDSY